MAASHWQLPYRNPSWRAFLPVVPWCLAMVLLSVPSSLGWAGEAAAEAEDEEKLPAAREVPLLVSDGVKLATTYYPGTKAKDSVPVVLLHGAEGSRKDYSELALHLQKQGHAVLAVDLRGHGESTRKPGADPKLADADYLRMVTGDMEAVKEYIRQENNDEKLNIEKLCVIGADMGASVAMTWAQLDWSRPPIGIAKLGQDVKALVLISPVWNTPGLPIRSVLSSSNTPVRLTDPLLISAAQKGAIRIKNSFTMDMRAEMSYLIVAGKGDTTSQSNAQRLYAMLKRYHPDPPRNDPNPQEDLFFGTLETKLQGTKMLGVSGLNLDELISEFIRRRLVEPQYPWQIRTTDPHVRDG